jgi:hypothetical protein
VEQVSNLLVISPILMSATPQHLYDARKAFPAIAAGCSSMRGATSLWSRLETCSTVPVSDFG